MMNRLDHLLCVLGEEASEIIKEVNKCQRFGIHNHFENRPNGDYLLTEVVQMLASLEMVLDEAGFEIDENMDFDAIAQEKKEKVEKYMHLAETLWGTVEPGSSRYWKDTAQTTPPVSEAEDEELQDAVESAGYAWPDEDKSNTQ
jgi:hypothetical protein